MLVKLVLGRVGWPHRSKACTKKWIEPLRCRNPEKGFKEPFSFTQKSRSYKSCFSLFSNFAVKFVCWLHKGKIN
jgi:hypothetical protein